MIKLKESRKQLDKAFKSFEELAKSKTFEESEDHWLDFLNRLEKVWKKSNDEVRVLKGNEFNKGEFNNWKTEVNTLRDKDPLLIYLAKARNSEEHSIQPITGMGYKIEITNPKEGGVLRDGDTITAMVTETIEAVPVTNYGILYNLPEHHLGKPITDPKSPFEIANLALQFYKQYLNRIENEYLD